MEFLKIITLKCKKCGRFSGSIEFDGENNFPSLVWNRCCLHDEVTRKIIRTKDANIPHFLSTKDIEYIEEMLAEEMKNVSSRKNNKRAKENDLSI